MTLEIVIFLAALGAWATAAAVDALLAKIDLLREESEDAD